MSVLNANKLGKSYKSRRVVDDVSLTVSSGQVVGLLGPNGAGKTTCFYMIVGLVPCGEGSIEIDGIDLTGQPMHLRALHGLGYLPQEASVFRKLSVADNIMAVLEIRKDLNKSKRKEILESLLHDLHIGHLADQPGISLSGGERRRVEIARALAANPRFILLDEPFAGVDPISVVDIQNIIEQLCERGIGILITDHNVRETLGICHHAYILNEGRVIAAGTPEVVLNNQHVRDVYLGSEFRL
ncbi:MAG: LPS export ABC transporter ATP-binding protein [Gammaproteobacteria bacterium]|jgi:lipopolysaccharide export system ATP-binding protein|nr:LPS export ABC transporter ATP-binding protein [Gammaproteobacteria bacterium]